MHVAAITAWIERNVGGRVTHVERQPRWRPVHFIDVTRDGEVLRLCARQARADMPMVFPLRHEMIFQQTLAEHGIKVPAVHGWCEEPECFVMDRVEGIADMRGLEPAGRDAVARAYIEQLALIHSLPTAPFKQRGIVHGRTVAEGRTVGARRFEALFRQMKCRPEPFLEFGLGWLRRNPGQPARHETPVVWDSGQFHQKDGELVAVMDLELGHIGDPMIDLACMRMRDSIVGFGNLTTLFEHYSRISGIAVEWDAIRRHHLFFGLTNELASHLARADPPVVSDFMVNLQWTNETNRYALEDIAALAGIDLPEIALPQAEHHSATVPARHLTELIASLKTDDPVLHNDLRRAFRLSRHLARWGEIGPQIVAANLDDIAELTGLRPRDWADGEAALEAFVLLDDGRNDERLVLLFNRRLQRAQALNGPAGSAMVHHHTLQPYGQPPGS